MENVTLPEVEEKKIYFGKYKTIDGYKAVINKDTGETYAVVTNNYDLFTHQEALKITDDVIRGLPEFGEPSKKATLYDNPDGNPAAKMETVYRFDDVDYDMGNGDIIHPTINMFNSYNMKWAFKIMFGAYRMVCSNGLVVGEQMAYYRKEHHQGINIGQIKTILTEGMQKMSDQIDLWKSWLDRKTTSRDYEDTIKSIKFNKKQTEELKAEKETASGATIEEIINNKMSYWLFYNILTQYITHRIANVEARKRFNTRLQKIAYRS